MIYFEILANLFKRELKTRYNGSILGLIWIIIYPFIIAILASGIFRSFFQNSINNSPSFLYVLIACIVWQYFFYGLINATRSIRKNREIVANLNFNWSSIILNEILLKLFDMTISLILFFSLFFIFKQDIHLSIIFLPFLILIQTIFLFGLGLVTATTYIYYKDANTVIEILLQIIYLTTPIIYPVSIVPSNLKRLIEFNPLTILIGLYRQCLFSSQININGILIFSLIALFTLVIGMKIFKKYCTKFAETI